MKELINQINNTDLKTEEIMTAKGKYEYPSGWKMFIKNIITKWR